MFYYPAVLKRHTGCFSTIWLVATKGMKVPRRDFLKVNVTKTCYDIMNYLLERVEPPRPGLPRPRFSLYLSSQLQYGVILVYHRQCVLFLEEIQSVVDRLLKQKPSQRIDMDDRSRPALLLTDALSLMEEADGAPDPLFGVLKQDVPSPSALIQMGREYLREASPEQPELTESSPAAAAVETGTTVSPDMITLRETEPLTIPTAEFEGVELADDHPHTIDFLLAQTDHFPEADLEIFREVPAGEAESEIDREGREGDEDRDRTKELTGSTAELQPTMLSSEEAVLLPQEEPGLTVEPPTDQHTPVSVPVPVLPSPPSVAGERQRRRAELEREASPEVTQRRRRRRGRQLIFFDQETQLSQSEQQQQISNLLTETTRPPLIPSPSHLMPSAAELLNNPCTSLPEELLFLWRQAATITPLSASDLQVGERGPESTDSEKEREREMVEMAEMAEMALRKEEEEKEEEEGRELSPKEIPRELAEAEVFDISGPASLPLEGSDQMEASQEISPMHTSEREGSIISRSALRDIPEEPADALGRGAPSSPGLLPELAEHEEGPVLFQSLLPPEADRGTVSNRFMRLLEGLSSRRLRAEQHEPYGDILISTGSASF